MATRVTNLKLSYSEMGCIIYKQLADPLVLIKIISIFSKPVNYFELSLCLSWQTKEIWKYKWMRKKKGFSFVRMKKNKSLGG